MNKKPLAIVPELSSILLHRARSLFDLEALLGFQPKVLPGLVFIRSNRASRWNE